MRWVYLVALLLLAVPALAHVGYVVEEEEMARVAGSDTSWLLSPFSNIGYLALMGATIIVVLVLFHFLPELKGVKKEASIIKKEASTYHTLLPWMARLGLGIALVGAGSARVLISPIQHTTEFLGVLQVFVGFLLLAGFLVGPMTWAAIVLYTVGLLTNGYLLGNLDFIGLALTILLLGSGKPGIDDLTGIKFQWGFPECKKYVPLVLRIAVGLAMIFLGLYEKLLNPHFSRLVVESYHLQAAIPVSAAMWVLAAGLIEVFLGIVIMLGWKTRFFTALTFVVLSVTFFYFNEAVFSHITLFTTLSMLFVTGGGYKSLDGPLKARNK